MKIGKKEIGSGEVYVIAEAGINHNGDLNTAETMILEAKRAGADAIKFQTFHAKHLCERREDWDNYELFTKMELSHKDFMILANIAKGAGIEFLSTPFDEEAVELLNFLGVKAFKVAAAEIQYRALLHKIGSKKLPVLLSCGNNHHEIIHQAIENLSGAEEVVLLHSVIKHPCPLEEMNLGEIDKLRNKFGRMFGLSDHSIGFDAPRYAIAMGACIIEKHFTLDKNMDGPDHCHSVDPIELADLVTLAKELSCQKCSL